MAEVREATTGPEGYGETKGLTFYDLGRSGRPVGNHDARRVQEVIARSTTPIHELTNPPDVAGTHVHSGWDKASGEYVTRQVPDRLNDRKLDIHLNDSGMGDNHAGEYHDARWYSNGGDYSKPMTLGSSKIKLRSGADDHTILHELGHYRSARIDKNPESDYRTPTRRGKEEAHADDNDRERFRPDPRDVRAGKEVDRPSPYETRYAWRGRGGNVAHTAYVKARKTPLVSAERQAQRTADVEKQNAEVRWKNVHAPGGPQNLLVGTKWGESVRNPATGVHESKAIEWGPNPAAIVHPAQFGEAEAAAPLRTGRTMSASEHLR
jgi:hypothetical protein